MKLRLTKREGFAKDPGGRLYKKDGDRWVPVPDIFRTHPAQSWFAITSLQRQLEQVRDEKIRIPVPRELKPAHARLLETMGVDWYVDPEEAAALMGWR